MFFEFSATDYFLLVCFSLACLTSKAKTAFSLEVLSEFQLIYKGKHFFLMCCCVEILKRNCNFFLLDYQKTVVP